MATKNKKQIQLIIWQVSHNS